jgi:catechol 2,3-dioxygenase-like lactoylglutathione lyase family enzyme
MMEAQTKAAAKLTAICPQFIVPDVVATAEYYRDVLGFKILGYFLDPPVFVMVARDAAEIHFGKIDAGTDPSPNLERRKGLGIDAYIWVNDLHAFHAELKDRGAKIIEGPVQRVYKCLELVVEDLNGFRLVFAMDYQHP